MKRTIRLTESDLHRIVNESVRKILREDFDFSKNCVYRVEDETYPSLTLAHKAAKELLMNDPQKGGVDVYWVSDDGDEYCSGTWAVQGTYNNGTPHITWLGYGHRG